MQTPPTLEYEGKKKKQGDWTLMVTVLEKASNYSILHGPCAYSEY